MGQQKSPEEIKEDYLKAFPGETGKLAYYLSNQITFLHIKWNEYREIYGSDPETVDMVNEVAPYFFWMYERILRNDVLTNKIQLHFKNSQTMYDYVFSPFEGTKALLAFIENNLEK